MEFPPLERVVSWAESTCAITKRVDDAMKHRAEDIRNRTNQRVETAPNVLSKLWDYVKTNANDPPLRENPDVAKLAMVPQP